ncbi:MAG TPA: TMEM175 family protein [Acidimicrobiales bacterium]|nr:TMEM175 family protein [Acidimicrobiales bacterium]
MTRSRMEAFSDGVIAIIITIMVLNLHQPRGDTFSSLRTIYPQLLAYALSFTNLAIYWVNHHHLLKSVRRVTAGILWSNLALLFWLSLFPFCTRWMATDGYASQTVAAYAIVLVLAGLAYYILQGRIVASLRPDTGLAEVLGRDLKGRGSIVAYAVAIPLAFVWHWGAVIIYVIVALVWWIPDRRLEHYLDHHAPTE